MLNTIHKYNPADYRQVLGLSGELDLFYKLHEEYKEKKTLSSRVAFEKHGIDLFFTLKHRALEGAITQNTAHEIREYVEDLLNDD